MVLSSFYLLSTVVFKGNCDFFNDNGIEKISRKGGLVAARELFTGAMTLDADHNSNG